MWTELGDRITLALSGTLWKTLERKWFDWRNIRMKLIFQSTVSLAPSLSASVSISIYAPPLSLSHSLSYIQITINAIQRTIKCKPRMLRVGMRVENGIHVKNHRERELRLWIFTMHGKCKVCGQVFAALQKKCQIKDVCWWRVGPYGELPNAVRWQFMTLSGLWSPACPVDGAQKPICSCPFLAPLDCEIECTRTRRANEGARWSAEMAGPLQVVTTDTFY